MKLLNSKELQQKKKSYSEVDLYKFRKIKERLERDILKLKEFWDNADLVKKKAVSEMSVFMKKMQVKKSEMLLEIEELKEQREKILEPLIEEDLERLESGANSTKKRLINEKIDKLDRIEAQINDRSLKLAEGEKKLKSGTIALEKGEKALKAKIKTFNDFISNNK